MAVLLANNVVSTLAADLTIGATSLNVAVGTGAKFPGPVAPDYFYATLISPTGEIEVVKVTARVNDVLTITRAQDSTTAKAFASGSRVEVRVNAKSVLDAVDDGVADAVATMTVVTDALDTRVDALEAFDTTLVASTGSSSVGYIQAGTGAVARTVQARLRDAVSVKDFGAVGDGVTFDTAAIKAACDYAIANDKSVYVPAGVYLCTYNVLTFNFTASPSKRFVMFGDGATSVLKMGDGLMTASFRRFFDLAPTVDMEHIELNGLVFDNNARGSTPPPTPFAYEQSHTIRFASAAGTVTKLLRYHNVIVKDPVADGMNNQGDGEVYNWIISNCSEIDRTRKRRSIQCSRLVNNLTITGFTVSAPSDEEGGIEQEPPVAASAIPRRVYITNCNVSILDLAGDNYGSAQTTMFVSNTIARKWAVFSGATYHIDNCDIKLETTSGRFVTPNINSTASNTIFRHPYNATTGAISTLLIDGTYLSPSTEAAGFSFNNCKFLIDYDGALPVPAVGEMVGNDAALPIASLSRFVVKIENCYFDPRAQKSVNGYRNGTWILTNNTYACATLANQVAAITYAPTTGATYGSTVVVDGGDFRNCVGHGFALNNTVTAATCRLILTGTHLGTQACSVTNFFTSGNIVNNDQIYSTRVVLVDSLPAYGISGDTAALSVNTRAIGVGLEYVATATSTTAANYRLTRQKGIKRDTTANRPTVTANDVGLMFLDTTLDADGKPIWWTGTAWVDATGLAV